MKNIVKTLKDNLYIILALIEGLVLGWLLFQLAPLSRPAELICVGLLLFIIKILLLK